MVKSAAQLKKEEADKKAKIEQDKKDKEENRLLGERQAKL